MRRIKSVIAMISVCCVALSSCGKIDEVSQKVIDDINSIGEVDLSDEQLIEKIESTYATLTDKQKEQVSNYADLLKAKDEMEKLYERRDKVVSSCSTAASMKNEIDAFLTMLDTQNNGMKRGTDIKQIIDITAENKTWTVSAVDPNLFNSNSKSWGNNGVATEYDNINDQTGCESMLAADFAQLFPFIEKCSIKVSIVDGKIMCLAYTSEKSTPLEEGIDCPKIVDGVFDESFEWSEIAGITKEGIIVGTAPVFYGSK